VRLAIYDPAFILRPKLGALSDSSSSKYRRRYWIILSTVALVISTLTLAYCEELASIVIDLLGIGAGDWDEQRNKKVSCMPYRRWTSPEIWQVTSTAIGFAVCSFYILDFALNGLQASLRNLLLDVTPPAQLSAGNAWHGRMTNAGNIVGFGFGMCGCFLPLPVLNESLGFLPLAQLPIIRLLGGDQFRKFCVICIVILVATVWTTCVCHEEEERHEVHKKRRYVLSAINPLRGVSCVPRNFQDVLMNIKVAVINLPKPIRRVCYVQLFAFMGWWASSSHLLMP
jgi:solute carrier family 45, member 1/2/4